MNKYVINDLVKVDFDYKYLARVIKRTLKKEKVKNAYFSIIFVDEKTILEINTKYRGINRVTDVISFAFEDNDEVCYNKVRVLGDIYKYVFQECSNKPKNMDIP